MKLIMRSIFEEVKESIENLDVLFFLPAEDIDPLELASDDHSDLREEVDLMIQRTLYDLAGDTPVIQLTGDLETRVSKAEGFIRGHGL